MTTRRKFIAAAVAVFATVAAVATWRSQNVRTATGEGIRRNGVIIRKSFKMRLHPGMEQEYKRRHDALWTEMKEMIREHGGHNYSIFLDRDTGILYGYIEIEDEAKWAASADTAVCRKWWDYMAPLMDVNPDNSPVSEELPMMFHLD